MNVVFLSFSPDRIFRISSHSMTAQLVRPRRTRRRTAIRTLFHVRKASQPFPLGVRTVLFLLVCKRLYLLVDTTRVILGQDGGYINANFINMQVKDERFMYIACQGPLPTTLGDFWQMVWEQDSNVIAMMTQEIEGGKVKCQRYWPDTPRTAEMVDDRFQITLVKDQHLDHFIIRLIEVKDVRVSTRLCCPDLWLKSMLMVPFIKVFFFFL